ncbi:MAG: hypothetical protein YK1309IOTA_1950005 [Marine Group I thaumarchaeote]|nr:MAG: hypothetical protein YK1309IOTA_1950005 [Marine Group I thaumarchaeote]
MDTIEIPLTLSIAGGQDEHKADEEIFGKFPIEGKPHMFTIGKEKEIQEGIKLRKKNYTIRESVEAWQDIHVYLEIAKTVGIDLAIGITGAYLYSVLSKFKSKIRIDNKDIPMDSDKDEIIKAMKEEIEKLRKDLGLEE